MPVKFSTIPKGCWDAIDMVILRSFNAVPSLHLDNYPSAWSW